MAVETVKFYHARWNMFIWQSVGSSFDEKYGLRFAVVSSEVKQKISVNKLTVRAATGRGLHKQVSSSGWSGNSSYAPSSGNSYFTPIVRIVKGTPKGFNKKYKDRIDAYYNFNNKNINTWQDSFVTVTELRTVEFNRTSAIGAANTSRQNGGNFYVSESDCHTIDLIPKNGPFIVNPGERIVSYIQSAVQNGQYLNIYYGSPQGTFDMDADYTVPYIWRRFGTSQADDPIGYALDKNKCDGKWHLVRPFNVLKDGKWNNVEEL